MRLTETDAGRSIRLRAGDPLEITLASNPTTGFQWEVSAGDSAVLRQRGEPLFIPGGSAPGRGGQVTLTFEAVGAGQTALKLIYHRPFETGVAPAQTYAVTVIVQ